MLDLLIFRTKIMSSIEEIQQKIRQVVLANLPKVTSEELSDDAELFSLGLNSLNTVPLVLGLEEVFGFEFEMDEISYESFRTLVEITELIKGKIGG